MQIAVRDGFIARINEALGEQIDAELVARAAHICIKSVHRSFEREGLLFSHFLNSDKDQAARITITDTVRDILEEERIEPHDRPMITDAVIHALRGAFYGSTEPERLYLSTLSRTYALLFTLNTEPRLIEYFQEMTENFHLYVGSDIIVRALSERYLAPEDQMRRNTLRMAMQAGATLALAEPVLNEVLHHLRASDNEFQNHFQRAQEY